MGCQWAGRRAGEQSASRSSRIAKERAHGNAAHLLVDLRRQVALLHAQLLAGCLHCLAHVRRDGLWRCGLVVAYIATGEAARRGGGCTRSVPGPAHCSEQAEPAASERAPSSMLQLPSAPDLPARTEAGTAAQEMRQRRLTIQRSDLTVVRIDAGLVSSSYFAIHLPSRGDLPGLCAASACL